MVNFGNSSHQTKQMDAKLAAWKATLSEKEKKLHELASIKLKKTLVPKDMKDDLDNGSYYAEKCHAFQAWLKAQSAKKD